MKYAAWFGGWERVECNQTTNCLLHGIPTVYGLPGRQRKPTAQVVWRAENQLSRRNFSQDNLCFVCIAIYIIKIPSNRFNKQLKMSPSTQHVYSKASWMFMFYPDARRVQAVRGWYRRVVV